jgi:outer membrane protein assembly factor BamA
VQRVIAYAFVLAISTAAQGQQDPTAEPPGPAPGSTLEELDHLTGVPLPGEGAPPVLPAAGEKLDEITGKPVTKVTAIDPPAGFNPVDDADVPLGIPYDAQVARKAVLRLWDTGSYRDIRVFGRPVPGGGVELLIEVQPMMRIHVLKVSGNKALDDDEVARAIEYTADRTILPDQPTLIGLRNKLQAAYAERGYREAKATLRLETTDEPGQVTLAVKIDEGRPERYTRIRIPGTPLDLKGEPLAASIGLEVGTVRDRARVDEGLGKLTALLGKYGYRDAVVGRPTEKRIGKHKLELTIPVQFGIPSEIEFVGNNSIRSPELIELLAPEGVFRTDPESITAGIKRLKQHYRRQGMFHALISAGRLCRHEKTSESLIEPASRSCRASARSQLLVFRVAEGPAVEVAEVRFEGNSYFDDAELGRELQAFMREKNPRDEAFQPIHTATVDAVGISDPRPGDIGRPRGAAAPTAEPQLVYVPELYLAGMEHLTGVYQEQGFLRVSVSDTCDLETRETISYEGMKFVPLAVTRESTEIGGFDEDLGFPCVLINEDLDTLIPIVTIAEGPQTRIHELEFEGNEVLLDKRLRKKTRLAVGQPYNEYRLREAERDIRALYGSKGYMFTEAGFKMTPSPDMTRAKVVFHIREGPQVRVGRIVIRGNSSTARRLIVERLVLEEGDLVTPESMAESEQRLMELGIFDGATVQMNAPETADEVKNIVVQVTEGKPQYLELRGGIATVEGGRGGFEYGYRNLGGWAINARFRARANYRLLFVGNEEFERRFEEMPVIDRLERHLLLGVSTDHFPGTKGWLGMAIDGIRERTNEPAFSAERWSGYVRIKTKKIRWRWDDRAASLPIEIRTGLERSEIELPENVESLLTQPQFQKWARMPEGLSTFWVTGAQISLDYRDDVFNPSRGIFISIGGDLVRSLANFAPETVVTETGQTVVVDRVSNYIRAQATASGYIPIYGSKIVLALSASLGYIFHLQVDSTTWADRYFYLGGVSTLRGFPEESLIPEDVYQDWKDRLRAYGPEAEALLEQPGGEAMLLLRSEFRYPLTGNFLGAVFFETGNIWRDQGAFEPLTIEPELKINMRPVAGGGLRYLTPLGPIAFDVGVNLDKRPHEDWFAWSFSIGSAF